MSVISSCSLPALASLLTATLFASLPCALSAAENPVRPDHGALAAALQPFVDRQIIAGAVALVADRERILDIETVGLASIHSHTPMREDSLFWLASTTKPFTGTAMMMLVEEGKVNLDDPVEKYLPEFKGQQVAEEKDKTHLHPPTHPITVREILSHTSGIIGPNEPPLKHTYVLKEDAAQYGAAPLKWEPGTKYEYNNSGITTAGRIIEVVSGQPYGDFVRQRILDPLGMKDTTYWPDDALAARLAQTAQFNEEKGALEDLPNKLDNAWQNQPADQLHVPVLMRTYFGEALKIYPAHYAWPAGGLFSTAGDLTRFGQMMLNGGTSHGRRYLSAEAIRQMTTNQNGNLTVGPKVGYGLGWMVKSHPEEGLSEGSFGHIGARGPNIWVDPQQGLVMILLSESADIQNRGEPRGSEQGKLRSAFFHAAVEKYGQAEK